MKHKLVCTDFKPYRKNTLVGFAQIHLSELRLAIRDISIHQKGASRWAALPGKPQINKDGIIVKDRDGKIQYTAILELDDRKTRDAFSHAVIAAVLAVAPNIFDGEAAA
jgi:hypothetical protein